MPKRILDGEGVWRSDKLARVEPAWMRAEYANLIPLALANGVFEANARRIWSQVYSYNRADITLADVEKILNEFERVKLLLRWSDEAGKVWGYWVGIEKPGRLPGQSRWGKNEVIGPSPPEEVLRNLMDANGFHSVLNGIQNFPGLGSGLGFGSGSGSGGRLSSSSSKPEGSDGSGNSSTNGQPDTKTVIRRLWAHYIEKLGKNPKLLSLTPLRENKAQKRLVECLRKTGGDLGKAEELMQMAIDALASSDFHCGRGENKKKYDSWDKNLFPSQDKLEWWLERAGE